MELQKLQDDINKLNQQVKQTDLALVNQPSMEIVEEEEPDDTDILNHSHLIDEKSILIINKSREFELSSSGDEDEFDQVNQRDSYTITKNKSKKDTQCGHSSYNYSQRDSSETTADKSKDKKDRDSNSNSDCLLLHI